MKTLLLVIAALMAVNCLAPAQTTILYQEDFGYTNGGTTLASVGLESYCFPGDYSGIYSQAGAHDGQPLHTHNLPVTTIRRHLAGSGIFFTTKVPVVPTAIQYSPALIRRSTRI